MLSAFARCCHIDQLRSASEESVVQVRTQPEPILIPGGSSTDPIVRVVSLPIHPIILLASLYDCQHVSE